MSSIRYLPAGMEDDDDDDDFYDSILKTCKNMKITIIPDITANAGLNGEHFDSKLDRETESWFETYKNMWNIYKNTPSMIETLHTLYLKNDNPLLLALKLFANCPGCNNVKNKTLPAAIIEQIAKVKNEKPEISLQCTDNMRMVAFNFIKNQSLPLLYKYVAVAYDLIKIKDLLEIKIRELVQECYYKDASHWSVILNLTDKFDIFDIVLPLILQDKISVAEEYLDMVKSLQRPTVELLDSLLDRKSSVINNCDYYIAKYNYTEIKMDKLHMKPLSKLIVRLARKYNLPDEATPQVNRSKSFGYLQYLIHKKYVEKSLNNESWRELIRDTVTIDCKDLHYELISSISYNNDLEEAIYWIKYYQIPLNECPSLVQDFVNRSNKKSPLVDENLDNFVPVNRQIQNQMNRNQEKFYNLKLNETNIILINTKILFYDMINNIKTVNMLAFDAEWKPTFNKNNIVSLIQISVRERIYLIDVLSSEFNDEIWINLGKYIFNNVEILKLGFSLNHDLIMFQKALPQLNISIQSKSSYIDLQELWRKLNTIKGFRFPFKSTNTNETLSSLVQICLGKKLDKSNQFSNWAQRPLRTEQLIYAALDAYCLLEIYDVIANQLQYLDINITDFIDNFITEISIKTQKTKRKIKSQQQNLTVQKKEEVTPPLGPNPKAVRVSDVKFVCDTMLEGLAKGLRKFGVDCLSISSNENRDKCVQIALRDNRFLLTKGFLYEKFSQYLPSGYCYRVQNNQIDDQLLEVFNYFNLIINETDVFSRCQICNCNEFILAKCKDLKKIKYGDCYLEDNDNSDWLQFPRKNCLMNTITSQTKQTGLTSKSAQIQIGSVSNYILDTIELFYICERCGKCYWDGSHLERVLHGKFKDVISKN